jgi:hypothetical protein
MATVIFVCFGVGFIVYGLLYVRRAPILRRDGIRCDGVVAGRAAGSASGGLFPVIEFQTADGHRLQFTSWIHWPPFLLPMRKRVPVRYSASNKNIAAVDTLIGRWGTGVGALLMGLVILALAPSASSWA